MGQTEPASGSVSEELIWVVLARFDAVLATGRPGWSFSDHDRQRLHAMSHLADARWSELARRSELVRSSELDTKGSQQLSGEPRLIHP